MTHEEFNRQQWSKSTRVYVDKLPGIYEVSSVYFQTCLIAVRMNGRNKVVPLGKVTVVRSKMETYRDNVRKVTQKMQAHDSA